MKIIRYVVPLVVAAILALTGCGAAPAAIAYDNNAYAAAVCVGSDGYRVPDAFCPIGDGLLNNGYGWNYYPYTSSVSTVVVPLVGYPVDRHVYVSTRPANVPTTNIDRGRFPERAAPGASAATAAVAAAPAARTARSSTITRGGLGVATATAPSAQAPNAAAPKPTPPAPKSRAVAPAPKGKK